jgi:septal ring factor EnvC (AmiA/AmiB activator)
MSAILKLIPAWAWVALALLSSVGYLAWQLDVVKADRDEMTAQRDSAQAKAASLTETLRLQRQLTKDIDQVADDAKAKTDEVAAAVVVADDRADSLQQQIERLLYTRRTCATTAAPGSKAGPDLTVVLAELRRSADETAGGLAEALDRSRIAGLACEAAYAAAIRVK